MTILTAVAAAEPPSGDWRSEVPIWALEQMNAEIPGWRAHYRGGRRVGSIFRANVGGMDYPVRKEATR